MTVAIASANADEVLSHRNDTPTAVTRAVPRSRCSISVVLNFMARVRAGSSMLWIPVPTCTGADIARADLTALTRQVSVQL
jgi:hypothetical protein